MRGGEGVPRVPDEPVLGAVHVGGERAAGPAWSRLDVAALAEDYYNSHHHQHQARKRRPAAAGEAAKGLKLILRHNSLYAAATDAAAARMTPPLVSLASV